MEIDDDNSMFTGLPPEKKFHHCHVIKLLKKLKVFVYCNDGYSTLLCANDRRISTKNVMFYCSHLY